jgi:hypothetical protein
MTTNVPKGAGRPAAAARSAKHAQRTPLPPKAGSPGAEAIAEAKAERVAEILGEWMESADPAKQEKPYGEQTVAELRKVAQALGVTGYKALRRGPLMDAILEAEKAKASTAERLDGRDLAAEVFATAEKSAEPQPPAPKARKPKAKAGERKLAEAAGLVKAVHDAFASSITAAREADEQRERERVALGIVKPEPEPEAVCDRPAVDSPRGKSMAKALAFVEVAAGLGWAQFAKSAPDDETYGVIVGRDEERITISWRGGVFVGEECYHSHPGRSPRKVINASAAKKIMAIPPAEAAAEAAKVTAHKSARPGRKSAGEATTARRKALPFDPETAADAEILRAIHGREVTWVNSLSGAEHTARVTGSRNRVVRNGSGVRAIDFNSPNGACTVRVNSIVEIR